MNKPEPRNSASATVDLETAQLLGAVVNAPEPIFRVDKDGTVKYANRVASELLAAMPAALGSPLPDNWRERLQNALDAEGRVEISIGERVYDIVAISGGGSDLTTVHLHDVTHHKVAALEAQRRAHEDPLTGLATRHVFLQQLAHTLALARRKKRLAAVLIIGLDDFKAINETLGHAAGDALLQATANRLDRCLRDTDTLARLGGDEFAVIQPEPSNADGSAQLARRLNAALREPVTWQDREIVPAASIGIAMYPDDSEDADELLHHADIALDRCKFEGGDDYRFFVTEMNDTIQRRRAIEHDLRAAIEEERLDVHYQPKFDLTTGCITGMEALVRWIDPNHGFVSPAEFIPIAETSHLIVPLGDWVLKKACRDTKAWNDAGLGPLKVAVNLSAVQFRHPALLDDLAAALFETKLEPGLLELEITETAAMNDAERAQEVFAGIARMGISLAIDDFGTGYSSLSYLKNFPVQRIKIDKAFVDDIGQSVNGGAIAHAVTTLGQSFGMDVTAEGVETAEQLAYLRAIDCQEAQGYLISKPLPAVEFAKFLENFDAGALLATPEEAKFDWNAQRRKWRRGLLGRVQAFAQ
jgi:diguanylate cyclase (GGDEF)-like protein